MINYCTGKTLERFASKYLIIQDMDFDTKKKVLELANNTDFPEKELLEKLLKYRESIDQAIAATIERQPKKEVDNHLAQMQTLNFDCQRLLLQSSKK